jgi:branched-chain amino acid transport system substrate-binding protein
MRCRRAGSAAIVAVAMAAVTILGGRAAAASPDSSVPSHRSDGVLRIGVLLPQTGEGNWIGLPGVAAAEYAVARINEQGGFNGADVELVIRDEGVDAATASVAIDELIAAGVDAVVGPASSSVALETLGRLMDAGILTCSPTATSLLLDDYPNRDLFFRTIPSDSLQMKAIAQQAQRSGVATAVVVHVDDEFGHGLAAAVEAELRGFDLSVDAMIGFAADDEDLSDVVDELSQHVGSTIIVLADQEQGLRALEAIAAAAPRLGGETLPDILVNDAIRPAGEQWEALGAPVRDALTRLGPVADLPATTATSAEPPGSAPGQEPLPSLPFALNTLDCINLIALSAIIESSDDPAVIAGRMDRTADDGAPCATFATCLELLLLRRDIDYNGANGQNLLYWFAESGDLGRAAVMAYEYNPATGLDREVGALQITLGTD